ncbi:BTB/POZ-like domain and BTB/POZ fold domain and BTB/POZ domain-containing protein [Strongyloides ratti]|uniref:BTB/POZ-like domain and BTB/POZ fold domain and BTB/POZ domain-containing protein n=1 Tax=Strongyloides ratti TaxID=34506 RepID=A0A090L235_STRRB|nr:BTB/POZ-like domain and BTB/POZ fold domain and BTB/POZ domain-containing protein [Strongyloides ratti]CEF62162.1 BTB/POZ-like domain and BTB/POZ fold domain and BTB/POZ domain-containing protein [Strongyloides ratti]
MITSEIHTTNTLSDNVDDLYLETHLLPGVEIKIKDGDLILTENCAKMLGDSISFDTLDFIFTIKYQKCDNGNDGMILTGSSKISNYEIVNKILIKVRSFNSDGSIYKDHTCMCLVGTGCEPFLMEFCQNLIFSRNLHLNIEIIYKTIEELPDFKYGDLKLEFNDGSCLFLYKNFISQNSTIIREMLKDKINEQDIVVLKIDEPSCEDFKEMLYYIYSPTRSIGNSFTRIAKISVKYKVTSLCHKLSIYLAEIEGCKWIDKIEKAIQLELYEAVVMLSKAALYTGIWDTMIYQSFDPVKHFGDEIYQKLIKPSIENAKKNEWTLF